MQGARITTVEAYRDRALRLIESIAEAEGYEVDDLKKEIIETATNIRFGEWNDTVRMTMDYYRIDPDEAKCILNWGEDQ